MKSFRWRVWGVLGFALLPVSLAVVPLLHAPVHAQAPASPPRTYAPTKKVRLPIQIDDRTRASLAELRLYVRAAGADWKLVQTGTGEQTSFDYLAEKDGEYHFLFVTVDKSGRVSPPTPDSRPPHQIIIVDTSPPEVNVVVLPIDKELYLKCEIRDANPDFASIKLDYLADENRWQAMELVQPDSPGVFRVPSRSVFDSKVRARVRDKAGNVNERIVDLGDPTKSYAASPRSTAMETPQSPGAVQTSFKAPSGLSDPLQVKVPDVDAAPVSSNNLIQPPPVAAPDVVEPKTIAPSNKLAIEHNPFMPEVPQPKLNEPKRSETPANQNEIVVPEPTAPAKASNRVSETPPSANNQVQGTHKIINTPRCTLDYAVENVFVGGQPKIEFWATSDAGRTWMQIKDESIGRSPAKLTLPGDGLYGLRIKANGTSQPPQPGEAPDGWIEVDTVAPTVRMLPPTLGTGADIGTLTIQWVVHDKNLSYDSINIFHASRPEGPWLPIASAVHNEGSYRWLIPSGIGNEVYIRLEAADRAGNIGRGETHDPVALPQPKVRVLSIDRAP